MRGARLTMLSPFVLYGTERTANLGAANRSRDLIENAEQVQRVEAQVPAQGEAIGMVSPLHLDNASSGSFKPHKLRRSSCGLWLDAPSCEPLPHERVAAAGRALEFSKVQD